MVKRNLANVKLISCYLDHTQKQQRRVYTSYITSVRIVYVSVRDLSCPSKICFCITTSPTWQKWYSLASQLSSVSLWQIVAGISPILLLSLSHAFSLLGANVKPS